MASVTEENILLHERLFQLSSNGDIDTLVLEFRDELGTAVDRHGSTALHYAAGSGKDHVCRYLINHGFVSVNAISTSNQRTALHWAARNGCTNICRMLIDDYHAHVDAEAKGQVTPLQLAIWQSHLETAKVLVELGASPSFMNHWGCGVAHWIGKCPTYQENPTPAVGEKLLECCEWLFEECRVPFEISNHHGQTPLHKAAFAGNLPVAQYLVEQKGMVDIARDHQGNSASDCAERSKSYATAKWLRRHASPLTRSALKVLGLSMAQGGCPPPHREIRRALVHHAKRLHPDRLGRLLSLAERKSAEQTWSEVQGACRLLLDWWEYPDHYDVQVRLRSRNTALLERPQLLWTKQWHDEEVARKRQKIVHRIADDISKEASNASMLAEFEMRLVSLLNTDSFCLKGMPLSQLPKEYAKNWHSPVPKPRDFGCRKLIFMIQKYCPNIKVEYGENKQPAVLRTVVR